MKLADLIREPEGNYMSHTRLLNLLGAAIMTWVVIRHELAGKLSDDLLIWYGGILVAGMVSSKAVSQIGAAKK